jgi:AraC-like DNA-binding protein
MARVAITSQSHLTRVFRAATGLPPGRFLSAVRLQAAKRLLILTEQSITDICFEVGYSSLGTFTRHFTDYVGTSPGRLRRLAGDKRFLDHLRHALESRAVPHPESPSDAGVTIAGRVGVPRFYEHAVVAALFKAPIPRGRPIACGMADRERGFRLRNVPDGRYYLFAAGLELDDDPRTCLLGEGVLRGHAGALSVRSGFAVGNLDVVLHPPLRTDPPIIVALPVLLAESMCNADPAAS